MASISAGHFLNVTVGAIGVAKRKLRGSELPNGWSTAALLLSATVAAGINPARAAIDLSAGATIGVEHDSNPLELRDSQAEDFLKSGFIESKDDIVKRLIANVSAANGVNGPTHVQLEATYGKLQHTHFEGLDHTEYNVDGSLDWKPSQVFDVSLEASQNQAPVAQHDIGGERVVQQIARQASATLRVRPTPTWQLSLTPRWFNSELPLPDSENFELREYSGSLGLSYLGAGPVVPGIFVTQAKGTYSGIGDATSYDQRYVGFSLNYKVTNFSDFSLYLERTQRTTRLIAPSTNPLAMSLEGTKPAYTGSLAYHRQLSVKTGINVSAFRSFQRYDVGVNTTIGTGFNGEINWATTAKLSMMLNTQIVRSTIDGLQAGGSNNVRTDLERSASLSAKYLITRRVSLHPYFIRRLHNSTFRSAVFNKSTAGLELTVTVD